MIAPLIAGFVLGLSAGFSPGPLSVLVISQTLKHGTREGVKVAFAPLITDLPIITLAMVVLTQLANSQTLFGLIALVGGMYLFYLAHESFHAGGVELSAQAGSPQSLIKGAVVNFLNPSPYIFWLTVGAPTVVRAWAESPFAAIAFFIAFYFCLIGAKLLLAALVGRSRSFFAGKAYLYLMRGLGVLLVIYGLGLFWDGVGMLRLGL